VQTQLDQATGRQIAADLVRDLRLESEALRTRSRERAGAAAGGERLQGLWRQIDEAGPVSKAIIVPEQTVARLKLNLEIPKGQAPPLVIAQVSGTERLLTYSGSPPAVSFTGNRTPFDRTLELQLDGSRYVITGSRGGTPEPVTAGAAAQLVSSGVGGAELRDVAYAFGVEFRQQGFRTAATADVVSMMGGGVCWIDVNNDGWLDLYAVNSYADRDVGYWQKHGGMPRNALFQNVKGVFTNVSRGSGADVSMRGNGCVAADLNGDGHTDLYVTAYGYDSVLWNDGHGHFSEGARAAGSPPTAGTPASPSPTSTETVGPTSSSQATPTRTGSSPGPKPASRTTTSVSATSSTSTSAMTGTVMRGSARSGRSSASTRARSTGSAPSSRT
jgi:hypothetical protein